MMAFPLWYMVRANKASILATTCDSLHHPLHPRERRWEICNPQVLLFQDIDCLVCVMRGETGYGKKKPGINFVDKGDFNRC